MSTFSRAAGAAAAIGLAVVGLQLVGVTIASAHTNTVRGSATCQKDGTYTVSWTVKNDYTTDETASISGQPGGSQLSRTSLALTAGTSGSVTQMGVPGTAKLATLSVKGVWTPDSFTQNASGRVDLAGVCGVKPTTVATAPSANDGDCVDNGTTSPTVVIPTIRGIVYRLDGATVGAGSHAVSPGKHTVTAESTVLTLTGKHSWTYRLDSAATNCGVTPETPGIRQSECTGTGPSSPAVDIDKTSGITYTVSDSSPNPGDDTTVTATAKSGHILVDLPSGWKRTSATKATYKVTFEPAPVCNGVDSESAANGAGSSGANNGGLAATGPQTGNLLFGAYALLLFGALISYKARRTT